jgi:hypothetical protein
MRRQRAAVLVILDLQLADLIAQLCNQPTQAIC